jgi:hypothetical protein
LPNTKLPNNLTDSPAATAATRRYPSDVQSSRSGWHHAEILQFKTSKVPNSLTDGAHLGLLWQPEDSEKHVMVLLHGIDLQQL